MIFENEANLYKHVLKIYKNPQNWWDSKKIIKTRKKFKNLFGLNHTSAKEFSYYLKKNLR